MNSRGWFRHNSFPALFVSLAMASKHANEMQATKNWHNEIRMTVKCLTSDQVDVRHRRISRTGPIQETGIDHHFVNDHIASLQVTLLLNKF